MTLKRTITTASVLLLALLSSFILEAQQVMSIRGSVRDQDNGQRMVAVNVSTGPHGVSTVTNDDGDFIIKVPAGTEQLVFSCLGYKTITVKIEDPAKPLRVRMSLEPIQLSEIVIESPENILSVAIQRVPNNYPDHPELSQCFYRETTQKGNRFIYVAEAVTKLYKTSYSKGVEKDIVEIEKGRRLISPKQSDTLGAKLVGGPMIPVYLDVAKNRNYILSEEEMKNYSFSMQVPEEIDGRPQIVIAFQPHLIVNYPLFIGKYYIDRETLAITRLEMHLDMSDTQKASSYLLVRKPLGVRFKPYSYEIEVNYKTTDNITRISYQRAEMKFRCDWRRKLFSSPYTVTSEMVVTSREPGIAAPPERSGHTFSRHDSYFDHTEYFVNDSFWGDYNIIAPTDRLNNAIDRLIKRTGIKKD